MLDAPDCGMYSCRTAGRARSIDSWVTQGKEAKVSTAQLQHRGIRPTPLNHVCDCSSQPSSLPRALWG
jgi:hypothetical protein